MNRFTRHDADLDGLLSVSEYCTLMRELLGGEAKGGGAGDEIGDGDGDDEADAEVGLLGLRRATAHATEQERLAFAKADKTGSGFLDLNELFIALTTHGAATCSSTRRPRRRRRRRQRRSAARMSLSAGAMRGLNVDPKTRTTLC